VESKKNQPHRRGETKQGTTKKTVEGRGICLRGKEKKRFPLLVRKWHGGNYQEGTRKPRRSFLALRAKGGPTKNDRSKKEKNQKGHLNRKNASVNRKKRRYEQLIREVPRRRRKVFPAGWEKKERKRIRGKTGSKPRQSRTIGTKKRQTESSATKKKNQRHQPKGPTATGQLPIKQKSRGA